VRRSLVFVLAAVGLVGVLPAQGPVMVPDLTLGTLEIEPRLYYMDRTFKATDTVQESLAAGGRLFYETPWIYGFGLGLAGYTSQGLLFTSERRGGSGLLRPDQSGYSVLGEAYLQARLSRVLARVYRQKIESPLINSYDCKMTPVTVEAATLCVDEITNLTILASHVWGIKPWTDTAFSSPSDLAGATGTNRPVTLGGVTVKPGKDYVFQVWEHYAWDMMNVLYGQADATWRIRDNLSFLASAQGMHQRDVGDALLGEFNTGMAGVMGGVDWYGLVLTAGYTTTANNHDMVNPWASYPAYTSLMEEDCNYAGQKAWMVGLAYDFSPLGAKGLSAFANHSQSYVPEGGDFTSPDQYEYNATVDYRLPGRLDGLWLRLRAAYVHKDDELPGGDYSDYRAILNYRFAAFRLSGS